jgi:hypothetical protein
MIRAIAISLAVSLGFFCCMVLVGELTSSPENLEGSVMSFEDIKYLAEEGGLTPLDNTSDYSEVLSKTGEVMTAGDLGDYTKVLSEDGTIIDFSK